LLIPEESEMAVRRVGVIMSGVTGRMGTNQHLDRSIMAIIRQGGIKVSEDLTIMPDPLLVGRNEAKLAALAERFGLEKYTTDLDAALAEESNEIFFDASTTRLRASLVERAARAGKAVYCEKPTAVSTAEAVGIYRACRDAGLKNGVVQDKLWLAGLRKLRKVIDDGLLGKIISVRGEFGYWVFDGRDPDKPCQRPSWNYRREDGGGIIFDMLCHWRYVIDNLFGEIRSVSCLGAVHVPERLDESGKLYPVTAEDSVYSTFQLEGGAVCHFNSSWCVRVRRDDLLTITVDGLEGSAVAGLRGCWVQPLAETPRPVWNPDIAETVDYRADWREVPDEEEYDNAFKVQWELFLRHVVCDEPFRWTLLEGAKGVQLAECGTESWKKRAWVDVPELEG
jgi:predicted dehydrogenase